MASGVQKGGGAVVQRFGLGSLQNVVGLLIVAALLVLLATQALRDPAQFISQLLVGITNGSILALVALGYTLVYGIVELINFAHGDNFMLGSFVGASVLGGAFFGLALLGAPIGPESSVLLKVVGVTLAFVLAMAICGGINVTIERIAYRPLRNAPRLAVLITAIGASFILQNLGLAWKDASPIPVPDVIPSGNAIGFLTDAVVLRYKDVFVIAVTIPLLLALSYFIRNTRQGKAMRATAQDREAAAMVGINVNRTIAITFLLGGMLAGASGVMFGLFNGTTVFDIGIKLGLFAFTAAVLGGIGNLSGAVLGGILIGVLQAMSDQYVGVRWTDPIIFSVLILVLVFRPTGLLGDKTVHQGGGGGRA